jgi:D-alanine-D-alanine ligase
VNEDGRTGWKGGCRVAILYNLKKNVCLPAGAPADALAEYDSAETVEAIQRALHAGGHQVALLEANAALPDTLRSVGVDICFNIAEGLGGASRESQVPALLEMLAIPYTGSKVLAHALSLDKAAAKSIWRDIGLPTPRFQVMRDRGEPLQPGMAYPLFVKPLGEGSGMGINAASVVGDESGLREQVGWVVENYRQPALVEEHLPGREFTIGLIGNRLPPGGSSRGSLYDERGYHVFPVLEIDSRASAGAGLYNAAAKSFVPGEKGAPLYVCPVDIPGELEAELRRLAVAAFEAIGALDLSRVDIRLGEDSKPYLLEINTLPGLNPTLSDLCVMAAAEGVEYAVLINEILALAVERYAREGLWQRQMSVPRCCPVFTQL